MAGSRTITARSVPELRIGILYPAVQSDIYWYHQVQGITVKHVSLCLKYKQRTSLLRYRRLKSQETEKLSWRALSLQVTEKLVNHTSLCGSKASGKSLASGRNKGLEQVKWREMGIMLHFIFLKREILSQTKV